VSVDRHRIAGRNLATTELDRVENLTFQVRKTWSVVIRRMILRMLTGRRYWQLLLNSNASDRIFAVTRSHFGGLSASLYAVRFFHMPVTPRELMATVGAGHSLEKALPTSLATRS